MFVPLISTVVGAVDTSGRKRDHMCKDVKIYYLHATSGQDSDIFLRECLKDLQSVVEPSATWDTGHASFATLQVVIWGNMHT